MAGQKRFVEINELLNRRLEEKHVLIAVHRGTWGGNIIENTVTAYRLALEMGGDMFECDIAASTDGELFTFHDGRERQILRRSENIRTLSSEEIGSLVCINSNGEPSGTHVQRFTEVLDAFRDGELFNLDRCDKDLPKLDETLMRYPGAIRQALFKTGVRDDCLEFFRECPRKYMYMPIVSSMAEIQKVLSYKDINTVGVEAVSNGKNAELFRDENIRWIKEQGLFYWANSIIIGAGWVLFGGYGDDLALTKGPEASWAEFFRKGADAIQTDWPYFLSRYRDRYFGEEKETA